MSVIYTSPKYVCVCLSVYTESVCVYTGIYPYKAFIYIFAWMLLLKVNSYKHRPVALDIEISMQPKSLFGQSDEGGGL